MITLSSKTSSQIKFPGGGKITPVHGPLTITIETGVAIFALTGTNPHDWTRDTLSFPVGSPCPPGDFLSGMAVGSPASFWTPMNNVASTGDSSYSAPVSVSGTDGSGNGISLSGWAQITIPGSPIPPPIGVAVDSATVFYSPQAGQPVIQLALAVFGNCIAMLRANYTAYIVTTTGGIVVGPVNPVNE